MKAFWYIISSVAEPSHFLRQVSVWSITNARETSARSHRGHASYDESSDYLCSDD